MSTRTHFLTETDEDSGEVSFRIETDGWQVIFDFGNDAAAGELLGFTFDADDCYRIAQALMEAADSIGGPTPVDDMRFYAVLPQRAYD